MKSSSFRNYNNNLTKEVGVLPAAVIAMGLAGSDGKVTRGEVQTVSRWLKRQAKVPPAEVADLIRAAEHIAKERGSLEYATELLSEDLAPSQFNSVYEMLMETACSDGYFCPSEREVMNLVKHRIS